MAELLRGRGPEPESIGSARAGLYLVADVCIDRVGLPSGEEAPAGLSQADGSMRSGRRCRGRAGPRSNVAVRGRLSGLRPRRSSRSGSDGGNPCGDRSLKRNWEKEHCRVSSVSTSAGSSARRATTCIGNGSTRSWRRSTMCVWIRTTSCCAVSASRRCESAPVGRSSIGAAAMIFLL